VGCGACPRANFEASLAEELEARRSSSASNDERFEMEKRTPVLRPPGENKRLTCEEPKRQEVLRERG